VAFDSPIAVLLGDSITFVPAWQRYRNTNEIVLSLHQSGQVGCVQPGRDRVVVYGTGRNPLSRDISGCRSPNVTLRHSTLDAGQIHSFHEKLPHRFEDHRYFSSYPSQDSDDSRTCSTGFWTLPLPHPVPQKVLSHWRTKAKHPTDLTAYPRPSVACSLRRKNSPSQRLRLPSRHEQTGVWNRAGPTPLFRVQAATMTAHSKSKITH
jgi:hypothetical protein